MLDEPAQTPADDPRVCGHCGRTPPLGYGSVNGIDLCHTGTLPVDADPPDCYRLVTIHHHAADGSCCHESEPAALDIRTLARVAIVCAKSSPSTGRFCPEITGNVAVSDVEHWYAEQIAQHAWTADDEGNAYCPRHNPADVGAPITLTSESYTPLGDSGWEARARMPEDLRCDVAFATIEIRQQRESDHD